MGNVGEVIDLADVRVFARIAELGSLSATARALAMPKSSVSRALLRLEEALGAVLVDRSTRHVRLTDAGRLFHDHALKLLDGYAEAEAALGLHEAAPSGTLRVAAPFTFAVALLAPMLPGFTSRYPAVRLVLNLDNRPIDLVAEEVDLAIRIGPLPDSTLVARKLLTSELWACASPAYLAAHSEPATVTDLAAHRLIAWSERPALWSFVTPAGVREQVEVAGEMVIPEPVLIQSVIAGGSGIGRLPDFLARDMVAHGAAVRVLPDHRHESVDIHAVYTSRRSLPGKARVFIDAMTDHFAQARRA